MSTQSDSGTNNIGASEARQRLWDTFDPILPLPPNDERYVDCNAARGSVGLLDRLAQTILLSSDKTTQLLSGHRGIGKTTELLRLQDQLERSGYTVVFCRSVSYIELNDAVEYTDVFLAILQAINELALSHGLDLARQTLQCFLSELWSILGTPITLTDGTLKFGLVELGFEIKKNPVSRQHLREHLRPRSTHFTQIINDCLSALSSHLKREDRHVVIVDTLDRMFRRTIPGTSRTTQDDLFVHSATQLTSLDAHLLYTVPPALLHSTAGGFLAAHYGADPVMLPMVAVTTASGEVNSEGAAAMKEIVQRRLLTAKAPEAIAETEVDSLVSASGGYTRALIALVRQSILGTTMLPIQPVAIQAAIRNQRNSFARSLTPESVRILMNHRGRSRTRFHL